MYENVTLSQLRERLMDEWTKSKSNFILFRNRAVHKPAFDAAMAVILGGAGVSVEYQSAYLRTLSELDASVWRANAGLRPNENRGFFNAPYVDNYQTCIYT